MVRFGIRFRLVIETGRVGTENSERRRLLNTDPIALNICLCDLCGIEVDTSAIRYCEYAASEGQFFPNQMPEKRTTLVLKQVSEKV